MAATATTTIIMISTGVALDFSPIVTICTTSIVARNLTAMGPTDSGAMEIGGASACTGTSGSNAAPIRTNLTDY